MNQRGEYGHSRRTNGRSPYGSPGWQAWCAYVGADPFDAARALDHINAEMENLVNDIYRAMGVDPATIRRPAVADDAWMQRVRAAQAKAKQSPLWSYWESNFSPKYDDWQAARKAFLVKPMTSEDYDRWLVRVNQVGAEANAKGLHWVGPATSLFAKPAGDTSNLVKWGLIGALAIGGIALVATLASSTKRERAPYERYRYGYLLAR